MRRIIDKVTVTIGLLAMLAACSSAVETPEPSETTPEPAAPTFLGTWTTTSPAWIDGEIIGTETRILTFSNSRYVQYTLREESDGTYLNDWGESGTWDYTDTMITRTWVRWDDDNERWETETTSVAKQYTWTEGGEVLFMAPWGDDEETDSFARYTKVDIPDPYPFAGSWKRVAAYPPSSRVVTQTFTFNDMFTFTENDTNGDDEPTTIATLTGTWRIDPDNNFILVTVESASGGNEAFGAQKFRKEQTLRLGYAPTDDIEKIQVSPYWREQNFDSEQFAWVDDTRLERMYGAYTYQFKREAATSSN